MVKSMVKVFITLSNLIDLEKRCNHPDKPPLTCGPSLLLMVVSKVKSSPCKVVFKPVKAVFKLLILLPFLTMSFLTPLMQGSHTSSSSGGGGGLLPGGGGGLIGGLFGNL